MANELNIRLDPTYQNGLSLTGKVRSVGGSQVGGDVTMTEPQAGYYTGDLSFTGFADGEYGVEFLDDATGRLVGEGTLTIKDEAQVIRLSATEIADAVWAKTLPS